MESGGISSRRYQNRSGRIRSLGDGYRHPLPVPRRCCEKLSSRPGEEDGQRQGQRQGQRELAATHRTTALTSMATPPLGNTFNGLISISVISGNSVISWVSRRRHPLIKNRSEGGSPLKPSKSLDTFVDEIILSAS